MSCRVGTDGVAYRELPVEQYSSGKYFPTVTPTSDRSDQSFRSQWVRMYGFVSRTPGV